MCRISVVVLLLLCSVLGAQSTDERVADAVHLYETRQMNMGNLEEARAQDQ